MSILKCIKKYTTNPVTKIKTKNLRTEKRKSVWINSLKNMNPKQKKKLKIPNAIRGKCSGIRYNANTSKINNNATVKTNECKASLILLNKLPYLFSILLNFIISIFQMAPFNS